MSDFQVNPPDADSEYLKCLNAAFGNWGDRRQFEWYFRRETGFPAADILICREHGSPVAGSGLTYRRVRLPGGEEVGVGIITGTWTLPEHRSQGLFSRAVQSSVAPAAAKGAKLLFGFVTADNASFRGMQRLGALIFPSFYIFSTESTPRPKTDFILEPVEPSETITGEMFEQFKASGNSLARFAYPTRRDFRAQFFERPHQTEVLASSNGDFAVIEKKGKTDLLQLFLPQDETRMFGGLLAHALSRNRKFFTFTMESDAADLGNDFGLEVKQGFLTVLPVSADFELPASLPWKIQNGDRA